MSDHDRRRLRAVPAAAAGLASLAALAGAAPVSAHTIQSAGQFKLAIGWQHEPAHVGVENAVQVIVTGPDGKPYTAFPGGGSGLKVVVEFGKPGGGAALPASTAFDLEPSFDADTGLGTPGETLAPIVPTAAGDYTFHVTGALGSQSVDITVTSGDQTFDTVRTSEAVQFPNPVPPAADVATAAQRAATRADAANAAAAQAGADAESAKDSASHALLLAIAALAAGVLLGGAGTFLGLRPRRGAG